MIVFCWKVKLYTFTSTSLSCTKRITWLNNCFLIDSQFYCWSSRISKEKFSLFLCFKMIERSSWQRGFNLFLNVISYLSKTLTRNVISASNLFKHSSSNFVFWLDSTKHLFLLIKNCRCCMQIENSLRVSFSPCRMLLQNEYCFG